MTSPAPAAARVRVRIPGLLRSYTGGAATVDIGVDPRADGGPPCLGDALAVLDARYPGMRFRVVDEQGKIRRHIRMFVDNAQACDLAAALPVQCELMIVGALSGG